MPPPYPRPITLQEQMILNQGGQLPTIPATNRETEITLPSGEKQTVYASGEPIVGLGEDPSARLETPTVLSSANISENVIPDLEGRLNTLSDSGIRTDANGQPRYPDGSFYTAPDENQPSEIDLYNPLTGEYKKVPATDQAQLDQLRQQGWEQGIMEPYEKAQLDLINSLKASVDANTLAQIQAIEQQFALRKTQQQDINNRLESAVGQSLLMSGSSRYAQISSEGIMASQRSFGLQKIAELDAQEKSLIAAAKQAGLDQNFELMEKQITLAETKRKEKATEAKALAETMAEENNALRERIRNVQMGSAIGERILAGFTDPAEILTMLNDGGFPGGVTAAEVSDTMKALTVSGNATKLSQDLDDFNWLKRTGNLPDGILSLPEGEQYFAYRNLIKGGEFDPANFKSVQGGLFDVKNNRWVVGPQEKGGTAKVTPGVGAKSPAEELAIRIRLFTKLMNILNKGQLSDTDRVVINDAITTFRDEGWTEQEIMTKLAQFPTDVVTPYNESFMNVIASNTDNLDKQQQAMAKAGQLLDVGSPLEAMRYVEDLAMKSQKVSDPQNYLGVATAETYVERGRKIKALVEKYWPATLGPISGSFQQILGKLKFNQRQEIQSSVATLVAQMRNDLAGTAVTESEAKFLEPLIPDPKDRASNFIIKVDTLLDSVLTQHNATRNAANLPEVKMQDILDAQKRLNLYSSGPASPYTNADDFLNSSIPGGTGGYSPDFWNNAP